MELGGSRARMGSNLFGSYAKSSCAAFVAILSARSRIKDDSKTNGNEKLRPAQSFSIVDAASTSVYRRSAAAAKATSGDKTAAKIVMTV
ncbi:hypothetical protein J5N97_024587 [Dioscorea zingiberensis]|uniref:Uncharacterized protein n=1 Tax=Dioscorea zingiberensis TaxID=325984 RepID=A0A9D5C7A3_9LILI|nr:hypothetical protein J5N97_024587 [Dioscorea zingiberensis]